MFLWTKDESGTLSISADLVWIAALLARSTLFSSGLSLSVWFQGFLFLILYQIKLFSRLQFSELLVKLLGFHDLWASQRSFTYLQEKPLPSNWCHLKIIKGIWKFTMLLKESCKHLHLYLKVVVNFNEFFALSSDLTDNHF